MHGDFEFLYPRKQMLMVPKLFSSSEYNCGEEILTIAAMTVVQVCETLSPL